jgi:protein-S-isoprenylcysteine O-methyltransferase Ste14
MRTAEREVPWLAHAFAWGGTLLFFASLSFFLYSYAVTFGETMGLPPDGGRYGHASRAVVGPVLVNILLFTVFALHHSLFARHRVRAWVARVIPAYLERSWYVWIASLLFIGVCLLWQPVPGTGWRAEGAWRLLALALLAVGVWLTLHSAMILDILELSGIRQLSPGTPAMEFKTSGPYGWIRHPIYTGWFLVVFSVPEMTMTRLVFAVVSSAYLLVAIPFEERSLRRVAGEAYAAYSRRVRWKLLPGLY